MTPNDEKAREHASRRYCEGRPIAEVSPDLRTMVEEIHAALQDLARKSDLDDVPRWQTLGNVLEDSRGLAFLALALQAKCPRCGKHPHLFLTDDERPQLMFCCLCLQHIVDGGDLATNEDLTSAIRSVGRIWLLNNR